MSFGWKFWLKKFIKYFSPTVIYKHVFYFFGSAVIKIMNKKFVKVRNVANLKKKKNEFFVILMTAETKK